MKMLTNNVLIALNEEGKESEKVTAGGIILTGKPDDDKSSKPATVIAVGPEVTDVKQGDVVYLDWATAIPVTVAGNSAAIIECKHIKAVMQMHSLAELRTLIHTKYKKKPTSFDGITLTYAKASFSLGSSFIEGSLHEEWKVTKGKTTSIHNSKELKKNLQSILKQMESTQKC